MYYSATSQVHTLCLGGTIWCRGILSSLVQVNDCTIFGAKALHGQSDCCEQSDGTRIKIQLLHQNYMQNEGHSYGSQSAVMNPITVKSWKTRWRVKNHRRLVCLFSSLLRLTSTKTSKPALLTLLMEIHQWPLDSPETVSIWWSHHPQIQIDIWQSIARE